MREFRLLLPWFDEQTAVRLQLGSAAPTRDSLAAAGANWRRATEKLQKRKIDRFVTATEPLADSLAESARRFIEETKLAENPDFRGAELRMVRLDALLIFQAKISTDAKRARFLAAYDGSLESLFSVCLPATAQMDPVQVRLSGSVAAISSDNPNLRFGGFHLSGSALTASFGYRPPWVQVTEYMGRLFVRNGYHRCWALLSEGVEHVIAIVTSARSMEELGAAEPGYIAEQQLLAEAPPFLSDFEDPDLYAPGTEEDGRRTITITATEALERA